MTLTEINAKKKHGDLKTAALMLGISYRNAAVTLHRPDARRHPALLKAMATIIQAREALLRQAAQEKTQEMN